MLKKIIVASLLTCFVVVAAQSPSAHAAEQKAQPKSNEPEKSYVYTAKEGDNYSVLARKAVQSYGIVNNVKLSLAQILAAESALTAKAGEPELAVGQSVTLKHTEVKAAMDAAKKLSPADEAAWNTYVPYVYFDTRNNG